MSFGTWVRRRRKALDLTQQDLATRVGCSVSLIFKIESDERRPSRQIAELLAQHLEIPMEERATFLKVARQAKSAEALSPVASLPAGSRLPSNLPLPLTSLIGREHEVDMVIRQLSSPSCRLLTLTGPGGVGKTRLALEVAHRLRETFEDGAHVVSLAGTSTSEFVIPSIASAIGFSFSGTTDLKTQLFHFLSGKHLLLILDNLEHLLEGIHVLDQLLESAAEVKLLATSREQLNLRAEWVFEIQGLPIPSATDLDHLETNNAAALFLQRARQVQPNFTPAMEDRAAIARICHLVEGLPLGLELAATWINTLSCREIAAEIERGLGFLSTSRRDIPERHRSLQAVFDYSWNLLSAEEQSVLRSLSVFQGGFPRDAAEQVAGATLVLLSSLLNKSLVRRSAEQAGRYSQHELVRQYAALHLHNDQQTEKAVRERHAGYYLRLWGEREPELHGSRQNEVLRQLTDEIDNFRAAWDWALAQKQFDLLGQSLRACLDIYDLRGWYAEGIEWMGSLIHLWQSEGTAGRSEAVFGFASALQGWFHFRRGRLHEAQESFTQALKILRPANDPGLLADVLSMCGPVLASLGENQKALEFVREGLMAARASGDLWRVAYAQMMQGGILAGTGRNDEAYESSQEALTHFRTLGDIRLIVVTLNTLGFVAMRSARYAAARRFLQESLATVNPAEDPWSAGTAYGNLGIVELLEGNAREAQSLLQKSISLFIDLGMMGDVALYRTYLGDSFAALGSEEEAEEHWLDAIQMAGEARALPTVLGILARLAHLYADQGDAAQAYEWALLVANHPASWPESKTRAEQLRTELQAKFPDVQGESLPRGASNKLPNSVIQDILTRQP